MLMRSLQLVQTTLVAATQHTVLKDLIKITRRVCSNQHAPSVNSQLVRCLCQQLYCWQLCVWMKNSQPGSHHGSFSSLLTFCLLFCLWNSLQSCLRISEYYEYLSEIWERRSAQEQFNKEETDGVFHSKLKSEEEKPEKQEKLVLVKVQETHRLVLNQWWRCWHRPAQVQRLVRPDEITLWQYCLRWYWIKDPELGWEVWNPNLSKWSCCLSPALGFICLLPRFTATGQFFGSGEAPLKTGARRYVR